MYEILTGKCGLSHAVSNCIIDVALAIDITELQLSELTSSLADSTNQKERNGLFIEVIKNFQIIGTIFKFLVFLHFILDHAKRVANAEGELNNSVV